MAKRDIKRELSAFYHASARTVAEVIVPEFLYLMIDGEGDPNTAPEYAHAVEALFTVSYKVKFSLKRGPLAIDYGVMPLEGLWWADDWSVFATGDRARWKWTMMIMQPDFVSEALLHDTIDGLVRTKGLPALSRLRLERFSEGPCAQILHVGPFTAEGPTIARLHAHVDQRGERVGKHHEIYLSDVRRAAPERWRTVLRQPMQSARSGGSE